MNSALRRSVMVTSVVLGASCTLVPPPPPACVCSDAGEAAPVPPPSAEPTPLRLSPTTACDSALNLALNPDRAGFPSPLESDHGWGGGSNLWELVDGRTSYESWAHGLAFTGGHNGPTGGAPWHEPGGLRQATIDFGRALRFDRVIVWNHGDEHNPAEVEFDVYKENRWEPLTFTRARATDHADGQQSGSATADTYSFEPVVANKLRYRFDNRGRNVLGTWNVHGWLYELEVFDCVRTPVAE